MWEKGDKQGCEEATSITWWLLHGSISVLQFYGWLSQEAIGHTTDRV